MAQGAIAARNRSGLTQTELVRTMRTTQPVGFALAVAVLIDATIVRIVIGPALLRIAGDWNWWPGGLRVRKAPMV